MPSTSGENFLNDGGYATIEKLEAIGQAHGKTVAQMALAWLLTQPTTTAPIIGANTVEQLRESFGAVGYRLSPEEVAALNASTDYPRALVADLGLRRPRRASKLRFRCDGAPD